MRFHHFDNITDSSVDYKYSDGPCCINPKLFVYKYLMKNWKKRF